MFWRDFGVYIYLITLFVIGFYNLSEEVLGEGACATVITCLDVKTNAEYAVKIIDKERHNRAKFNHEIEMLRQCRGHPNLIQLIDNYEDKMKYYLVFEKVIFLKTFQN